MGSPSRNVQYHPPRLSEDRLNLPQPHSPSLPTHCSGKSGMRPVEHQAVVAPGIRMGDVAQADDGVAGADTASPVPEQVPVHLLDAPERPTPAQQHRGVRQMQVRPKPGPFRSAGDDRGCRRRPAGPPVARRGRSPGRDPWSIFARSEPRSRPGCRSTLNEISERGGLHDRWRLRTIDSGRGTAHTARRWAGQPIPSSRRRVRMPLDPA